MESDHMALALKYVQAVSDKRFDQFVTLVHPDAQMSGNVASVYGATDFVAGFVRLAPILLRNEIRKVFVDGNDVCVIYDFVTNTPAGTIPTVEWLTIENDRVRSSWLLFDRSRWPEVLQTLQQRAADQ